MADKNISELPALETLQDDSLLVVEQDGTANKMPGAMFKQFARNSVAEYVTSAMEAAERAETAALEAVAAAQAAASAHGYAEEAQVAQAAAERALAAAESARVAAESAAGLAAQEAAKNVEDELASYVSEAQAAQSAAETAQGAAESAANNAATDAVSEVNTQMAGYVSSAQAAQRAAELARDEAQAIVGGDFLPLSGGAMTGALTLAGDPTADLHAVPKQYVDSRLENFVSSYTLVDYIQSSGTQYIDTEYQYASGDVVTLVCSPLSESADEVFFGSRPGPTPYQVAGVIDGRWRFQYTTSMPYVVGQKYTIKLAADGYWYIDDVNTGISGGVATGVNAYLFAGNHYLGVNSYYPADGRVWSFTVERGGAFIHKFTPCIKSGDVVGMVDVVTEQFHGNAGTGVFIAGTDPVPIEKGGTGAASAADALANLGAAASANPTTTGVLYHQGNGTGNTDVVLRVQSNNGVLTGHGDASSAFHLGGVPVAFDQSLVINGGMIFQTSGQSLDFNNAAINNIQQITHRGSKGLVSMGCDFNDGALTTTDHNFIVKNSNINSGLGASDNAWSYQSFAPDADGAWERVFGVKADGTIVSKGGTVPTVEEMNSATVMETILDMTTTAAASQVDVDLSGIDWDKYMWVKVYMVAKSTTATSSITYSFKLLLNNLTSGYYYHNTSNNESGGDCICYFYAQPTRPCFHELTLGYTDSMARYRDDGLMDGRNYDYNIRVGRIEMPSPPSTLNLVSANTDYQIAAGTKIKIVGVKA